MAITFSGLASGLDTDRIVTDLTRFGQRRIDVLKAREQVEKSRQSAVKTIEKKLQELQTQTAKLGRPHGSVFDKKTTTVSESSLLTAASGSAAQAGVTSLRVLDLAKNHQIASQGFDSQNSEITQGTFQIRAGGQTATITIDANNNTLNGLAEAISNAGVGVAASVISDGSSSSTQPYRLLLSSEKSGTDNAIVITNSLAADGGGAFKPNFGSTHVGPAVNGAGFAGTSGITSNTGAGNYTGSSNDTFQFTVMTAGTVGTDDGIEVAYTNSSGSVTGTITLNQADAGIAKSVANGVQVQFGAGTLVEGNTFSIDAFAPTVQSAENARVQIGSGSGAIVVQSSTNTVTNLIPGVSLNLLAANPDKEVKVTVSNDIQAAKDEINEFVKDYNDVMDYITSQTKFNAESGDGSLLTGNRDVKQLKDKLQQSILAVSPGLPASLNRLSALGISNDGKGKLKVDGDKLDNVLNGRVSGVKFEDLKQLFGLTGTSSNSGIEFVTGSRFTKESASPIGIDITQAAEQAKIVATNMLVASTVIDETNNSLVFEIDDVTTSTITLTSGTYSQTDLAREVESRVNESLVQSGPKVTVGVAGGHLFMMSEKYGSASNVSALSGTALSSLGFDGTESDEGVDVAGSFIVNSTVETATGVGRLLKGASGNENTADLDVLVNLTPSQVQAGADASLTLTRGIASRFDGILLDLLDPVEGRMQTIEDRFAKSIEQAQLTTSKETQMLDDQKSSLLRQFAALEQAMNRIKQNGEYLTNAFSPRSSDN